MLVHYRAGAPAAQIALAPARDDIAACRAGAPLPARPADFMLVVTQGESLGKRVPIGSAPVVIGRGVGVDLQIADPTVSRHHCVVWHAAGRCWVRDLGSTNHTRVNKRSSVITELSDGDVIVIGQASLTIVASRPSDEPEHGAEGAR